MNSGVQMDRSFLDDARADPSLRPELQQIIADADVRLVQADADLAANYPGDRGRRQPVHTVYVPADKYLPDTAAQWGEHARQVWAEQAPTPAVLTKIFALDGALAERVHERVSAKLAVEPIEDLRIDFEDGYGVHEDETQTAVRVARSLRGTPSPTPFIGVRFKSLESPTRRRGLTTLYCILAEMGSLPAGFLLTLPKVTSVDQVLAMVQVCDALEKSFDWAPGSITFEIQIETPQAILGADGRATVAPMLHAAGKRCTALHYGTYDYSASLGISAAQQSLEHPAADHAKAIMQLAAAGTGVQLSDGSTNVLPIGDADAVRRAWQLSYRLTRRSLERAYHQGWDMHPGQLPPRFVANYAFYLSGLDAVLARLAAYLGRAASGFLDEPATAVAMAGFALRATDCGAAELSDVAAAVGVPAAELYRLARRIPPEEHA